MASPDYYALLNVAPTSDPVVIQAAYKALMRKYHPDTSKLPDAVARTQALNEAYEVLSKPDKRKQYDEGLRRQAEQAARAKAEAAAKAKAKAQAKPQTTSAPSAATAKPETANPFYYKPSEHQPTPMQPKKGDGGAGAVIEQKLKGCGSAVLAVMLFIVGIIAIGGGFSSQDPTYDANEAPEEVIAPAPAWQPSEVKSEEKPNVPEEKAAGFTAYQRALVDKYQDENNVCRGGSGAARVYHSCAVRTAMSPVMAAAGLCYGKEWQLGADMEWHLCTGDSTPAASSAVRFRKCRISIDQQVVHKGDCVVDLGGHSEVSILSSDYALHISFDSADGGTAAIISSRKPDLPLSDMGNGRLVEGAGGEICGGGDRFEVCWDS